MLDAYAAHEAASMEPSLISEGNAEALGGIGAVGLLQWSPR